MGSSETIYFMIAEEPEPEPFPTTPIAASLVTVAVVSAGMLIHFRKRKH